MLTVYAAFSLLAILGFGVLAVALIAGALLVARWVFGLLPPWLGWPVAFLIVAAMAAAVLRALRNPRLGVRGVSLGPDQEARLWALAHELARTVGSRAPDEIYLIGPALTGIRYRGKLLGFVQKSRALVIGYPLLLGLSVDQLRAALADALARDSRNHSRLAELACSCRETVEDTLDETGIANPAGWVFRAYGVLYRRIDAILQRSLERASAKASARIAGRTVAASALRERAVLEHAQKAFDAEYVDPAWHAGYRATNLFGGLNQFIDARATEFDEVRFAALDDWVGWDFLPLGERVAAIASVSEDKPARDDRPALVLLNDPDGWASRLQDELRNPAHRTLLDWPDLTAAVATAALQASCDLILRKIARHFDLAGPHGGSVLALLSDGKADGIATALQLPADAEQRDARLADAIADLVRLAALSSGSADWQHTWSGPPRLVSTRGDELPAAAIAELTLAPEDLPHAQLLLAEHRIDLDQVTIGDPLAGAAGAELVTAFGNVELDGVDHDLVVTTAGLVLIANPGHMVEGEERLRVLTRITPASELIKRHMFLSYRELAEIERTREIPFRLRLTLFHGGQFELAERWGSASLAYDSHDRLFATLGIEDD